MNPIEEQEVTEFFEHGDMILPTADIIICTEKGTIAFVDQNNNKSYAMRYGGLTGEGFTVMQYCTKHRNTYTERVIWLSEMYWKTLNYDEIPEPEI